MENYIFDLDGNYKGLRGSEAQENEIAIEQTEINKTVFESFVKPILVKGKIIESATQEEIDLINQQYLETRRKECSLRISNIKGMSEAIERKLIDGTEFPQEILDEREAIKSEYNFYKKQKL